MTRNLLLNNYDIAGGIHIGTNNNTNANNDITAIEILKRAMKSFNRKVAADFSYVTQSILLHLTHRRENPSERRLSVCSLI